MIPVFTSEAFHGPEQAMMEDSIVLMLQPLHAHQGGYLKLLGYYNGELDSQQGVDDLMRQAATNAPFVLVAAGANSYESRSTSKQMWRNSMTMELLFGSANLRSHQSRLRGDVAAGADDLDDLPTRDPGIYRMVRDVRNLILGRNPGVAGGGTFGIVRIDVVIQDPRISLWRAQYRITYDWDQNGLEWTAVAPAREILERHNIPGQVVGNPVAEALTEIP